MNFLNEVRTEASKDLDMLAEVTKTNLGCDSVFINVTRHDKLYSVGLDLKSGQAQSHRLHSALDSVCRATVSQNQTIALEDTSADPTYCNLPDVENGPIAAYLGVPLRASTSQPYGAICAVSETARKWKPGESAFLEQLSVVVSSLITKELQNSEMDLLHETIRETDLVLMTLAAEYPSLVSVHDEKGGLLFSSLALTRLAAENTISETAFKLIKDSSTSDLSCQSIVETPGSTAKFGSYMQTRSGLLKHFETSVTLSNNGTYFLEWSPLEIANTH